MARPAIGKLHDTESHPDTKLCVSARFDPDTFSEIRALAISNGVSVAEQIRLLVEHALENTNAFPC